MLARMDANTKEMLAWMDANTKEMLARMNGNTKAMQEKMGPNQKRWIPKENIGRSPRKKPQRNLLEQRKSGIGATI
jgi:hypothetical protein